MKHIFTITMLLLLSASVSGQNGSEFSLFLGKNVDGKVQHQILRPFIIEVIYKDADEEPIFVEKHTGVTDIWSHANIVIGQGEEQIFGPLTPEGLLSTRFVCYKVTTLDDLGNVLDMMEVNRTYYENPLSSYARNAVNAQQFADNTFVVEPQSTEDVISKAEKINMLLQCTSDDVPPSNMVTRYPLRQIMRFNRIPSAVDGTPLDAVNIGTGLDCATFFGFTPPEEVESKYELCVKNLLHTYNALGVINKNIIGHSPQGAHNTAAIFADNNSTDLSAGLHARARTWGVYATANNGVVGISTGGGNGTGVWGTASQAPDSAGFKYAVLGHAGSLGGVWAAAFFGSGFYTGSWLLSSDARLKTDIRPQTNALDKIMQLRPSSYQYRMDTPYGFSPGLHHGFIAQEMEEVLPELVTEVKMPESIETNKLDKTKGIEYKAINYTEIIAVLTSAVQELNTSLTAKIEAQAKEIDELREIIKHQQVKK